MATIKTGQLVRFVMTTKDKLDKSNKIVRPVEIYMDDSEDNGNLYIVPIDDTLEAFKERQELENKLSELETQKIYNQYMELVNQVGMNPETAYKAADTLQN